MTQHGLVPASDAIAVITSSGVRNAVLDRTVIWLAALFMVMVLMSAYLGWSATATTNEIYAQASVALKAEGRPVPPNPTINDSPLAMLRNMTTYMSLLGALVAIVLGHQMIIDDRRSGVFPLLASRPFSRMSYAAAKLLALFLTLLGLLVVAALTNALTMLVLAGARTTAADWLGLLAFYGISGLYLLLFGLGAMAAAALFRSETMALLVPITVWMALLFILPQVAANINPMAALNPVKAMVAPPGGAFFAAAGPLLAPVSFTSTYRDLTATILGFAPADIAGLGTAGGMLSLVIADVVLAFATVFSLLRLDPTRSDTSE
jgi:ABC-type transport system involved in multi-copper enzyme maturation permease subunit